MLRCLISTIPRVLLNGSSTLSRSFSCSKYVLANYYDILKVGPKASVEEIKEAYFKLSKENHPDLHPNDPTSHDRFIQLQEAYQVLSNAASRKKYDVKSGYRRSADHGLAPDPDFVEREEWYRKLNERRIKEMEYKKRFGRRPDDPRNFYSYSETTKSSPKRMQFRMKLLLMKREFDKFCTPSTIAVLTFVSFFFCVWGQTVYFRLKSDGYESQLMSKPTRLPHNLKDP